MRFLPLTLKVTLLGSSINDGMLILILFHPNPLVFLIPWRHLRTTLSEVFLIFLFSLSTISKKWNKFQNVQVDKDVGRVVGVLFRSLKGINEFQDNGDVHKWRQQLFKHLRYPGGPSSFTFCSHVTLSRDSSTLVQQRHLWTHPTATKSGQGNVKTRLEVPKYVKKVSFSSSLITTF